MALLWMVQVEGPDVNQGSLSYVNKWGSVFDHLATDPFPFNVILVGALLKNISLVVQGTVIGLYH